MEQPGPVGNQPAVPKEIAAGRERRAFGALRWAVVAAAAAYFVSCGLWDPQGELLRALLGMAVGGVAVYGDLRSGGRGRSYVAIALVFFVIGTLANGIVGGRGG